MELSSAALVQWYEACYCGRCSCQVSNLEATTMLLLPAAAGFTMMLRASTETSSHRCSCHIAGPACTKCYTAAAAATATAAAPREAFSDYTPLYSTYRLPASSAATLPSSSGQLSAQGSPSPSIMQKAVRRIHCEDDDSDYNPQEDQSSSGCLQSAQFDTARARPAAGTSRCDDLDDGASSVGDHSEENMKHSKLWILASTVAPAVADTDSQGRKAEYKGGLNLNWRSYEGAKEHVAHLRLPTPQAYREWSCTPECPADLPSQPEVVYQGQGWESWDSFLGIGTFDVQALLPPRKRTSLPTLALDEGGACHIEVNQFLDQQNVALLEASNKHIFKSFHDADASEAETTDQEFSFGQRMQQRGGRYRSFTAARSYVWGLRLKIQRDYREWSKGGSRPADIPSQPDMVYRGRGWLSWPDFLGTEKGKRARSLRYRLFEEAQAYVSRLGLNTIIDYYQWSKSGQRPSDIPSVPYRTYRNHGWICWPHFLGTHSFANVGCNDNNSNNLGCSSDKKSQLTPRATRAAAIAKRYAEHSECEDEDDNDFDGGDARTGQLIKRRRTSLDTQDPNYRCNSLSLSPRQLSARVNSKRASG